jgi:mono/diheme cytochrome c family protein
MKTQNLIRSALAIPVLAVLTACAGGSGAPTEVNPVTTPPPVADYTGPAPANADVQAFRINLWENIKANNRCGACHGAGGQSPTFARNDDVNLAYQAALPLANLPQPSESRLVTKVAGGHNCWLSSNAACGDTMTVWIRNWAGSVAGGGRTIQLQEPPIRDVGESRSFPDDGGQLYSTTIWPLVRNTGTGNCVRCHAPAAGTPQSPFFASGNLADAYAAARSKINLDSPDQSRLVVRLRDEFHNCWSGSCAADAAAMQTAVNNFVNAIQPTQVDPTLVLSKAVGLFDGTVASGGNRFESAQIALYEFKTGMGTTVFDTSGVEPAANLTMSGSVEWVGGWGINVRMGGKAQGTTSGSRKLADLLKATGEFSIEAWAAPANVVQEDAYIVSYSGGTMARNATLAQREYQYEAMVRSNRTDSNGAPVLITRAADRDAQAALQHLVLTYDPVNGRRLYVNGRFTDDADAQGGGTLSDWDDSFALVLGNETSGNRQWQGVLRLVAVHNRALTVAQIEQNFAAGVGERYFLLFNVAHLTNVPRSYVMFETSIFDSYGYLFHKPTFISLDSAAQIPTIPLRGMRIGVNGLESRVGQAYIPLDTTISASSYQAGTGQLLSSVGTIIGLEKGADSDQFFLTFEQLGTATRTYADEPAGTPPGPDPTATASDIGLRTFDEISASLSAMTGVPRSDPAVEATYALVRQSLPAVEGIATFASAQQVAIAQLATQYCDVLASDDGLATAYFPGLNLNASASSYFSSQANRDLVIVPLANRAVGSGMTWQPDIAEIRTELNDLIGKLLAGGASTRDIVKASCAAVTGSAAMTLQ